MKMHLKAVLIILLVFLTASCENMQKKMYFFTNLDINTRLSIGTRIYYSDLYVGRITSIIVFMEDKQKRVKFFLFQEYRTIAREGAEINFKVDNDNIVEYIYISTDLDLKNSEMLPEEGVFISVINK